MTDYIFQESSNGIKFIGDFESFYQNEKDPWEQSASQNKGKPMKWLISTRFRDRNS